MPAPAEPSAEAAAPADDADQPSAEQPSVTAVQTVSTPAAATPIVASIRAKLADPALRKSASSEDLAALEAFYNERSDPLWMTDMGFSREALAAIDEVMKADDWGLSSAAFDLPAAGDLPDSVDEQALGRDQARPRHPEICAHRARRKDGPHQAEQAHRHDPELARSEDGDDRDRRCRSVRCLSPFAAPQARAVPAPAPGAAQGSRRK